MRSRPRPAAADRAASSTGVRLRDACGSSVARAAAEAARVAAAALRRSLLPAHGGCSWLKRAWRGRAAWRWQRRHPQR